MAYIWAVVKFHALMTKGKRQKNRRFSLRQNCLKLSYQILEKEFTRQKRPNGTTLLIGDPETLNN